MDSILISDILKVTEGELLFGNKDLLSQMKVTNVTSDSRVVSEGTLFLCIKGERVDGHSFLNMAVSAGAVCSFVTDPVDTADMDADKVAIIKVNDVITAIQKVARWHRKHYSTKVIGVTGSVGKTTTKEMIACALSAEKNVLKTIGNRNSQLGVALMMFEFNKDYEIAVIEMGISEKNEMDRLTNIASPEVAVVTNVGVSHIANLGSRENIRQEKLNITCGFPESGGVLYVCGNNDMLKGITADSELLTNTRQVVSFGSEEGCEVCAYDINVYDESMSFVADIQGEKVNVVLNVLGIHNVHNALCALALCKYYGVDLNKAALALKGYAPMAMRGEVLKYNNATVIDDTYNASPDSMKSALNVLWDRKCDGKRYAVFADVLELGDKSDELHREVGEFINEMNEKGRVTDVLITYGTAAKNIADEVRKCGVTVVESFDERDMVTAYLKDNLKAGDVCIIKGSRGMKMDQVVNALRE